jgi:hypothetical protein
MPEAETSLVMSGMERPLVVNPIPFLAVWEQGVVHPGAWNVDCQPWPFWKYHRLGLAHLNALLGLFHLGLHAHPDGKSIGPYICHCGPGELVALREIDPSRSEVVCGDLDRLVFEVANPGRYGPGNVGTVFLNLGASKGILSELEFSVDLLVAMALIPQSSYEGLYVGIAT